MKILCALTCLDTEIGRNLSGITSSFEVIASVFKDQVHFLMVIQRTFDPLCPEVFEQLDLMCGTYGVVRLQVEYLSVSKARNDAIEFAVKGEFDRIFFHDVSIVFTREACEHFDKYSGSNWVPCVRPMFDLEKPLPPRIHNSISIEAAQPVKNSYVWTYLLNVACLGGVRFDLDYGGGSCSTYKSGEDLLFLFQALLSKRTRLVVDRNAYVRHPPRDKLYQKHLAYALGQGRTFRLVMKKYPSLSLYLSFFLFLANATFRVLLCRQHSVQILFLRLKGFLTPK